MGLTVSDCANSNSFSYLFWQQQNLENGRKLPPWILANGLRKISWRNMVFWSRLSFLVFRSLLSLPRLPKWDTGVSKNSVTKRWEIKSQVPSCHPKRHPRSCIPSAIHCSACLPYPWYEWHHQPKQSTPIQPWMNRLETIMAVHCIGHSPFCAGWNTNHPGLQTPYRHSITSTCPWLTHSLTCEPSSQWQQKRRADLTRCGKQYPRALQ